MSVSPAKRNESELLEYVHRQPTVLSRAIPHKKKEIEEKSERERTRERLFENQEQRKRQKIPPRTNFLY